MPLSTRERDAFEELTLLLILFCAFQSALSVALFTTSFLYALNTLVVLGALDVLAVPALVELASSRHNVDFDAAPRRA